MLRWLPYPFLRFTPALIVGVLIGLYTRVKIPISIVLGIFVLYSLLVGFVATWRKLSLSTTIGTLGLVAFIMVGVIRTHQCDATLNPRHLPDDQLVFSHYVATVTSVPERRENSWRTQAQLEQIITRDSTGTLQESPPRWANVLMYQPKSDSLRLLRYGDRIVVKGAPQAIEAPANPGAFDAQTYWNNQQIFYQHYLRADRWRRLDHDPSNPVVRLAYRLRQRSRALLTEALADEEVRGVALALVLGIKDQLDERVRAAYGHAGAMHVLAVSGLHIGIVYGVLAFLLLPLKRIRGGRIGHALTCVAVLWLFALVTGGSVSVVRAATMFTCVILADTMQRRSNIFNTLALSAFLLLLINPYYLLSVGFQLSYLAVLGIVYLQPRIYRWLYFRAWLADKMWALTAVSIAAQLATLPISLYYFHQFPTYFWLANLVVIPAAFVILSLGLLTIGVGAMVSLMLPCLGSLLSETIDGVNTFVYALERLPLSHIDDIYVSLPQVIALYISLVALLMLFHYRRFRYLTYGCGALIVAASLYGYRTWQQDQQRTLTFYQVKGRSSVDFTQGRINYHWGLYDEQSEYQIALHWLQSGLNTTFLDTIPSMIPMRRQDGITLAVWQGQRIAFVRDLPQLINRPTSKVPVDYLVVSNNAARQIAPLDRLFSYKILIIDSSNSNYYARQLATEAKARQLDHHSVPAQGAFQAVIY